MGWVSRTGAGRQNKSRGDHVTTGLVAMPGSGKCPRAGRHGCRSKRFFSIWRLVCLGSSCGTRYIRKSMMVLMSMEVDVRFPLICLPTPSTWQDAIRANGFSLEVDQGFDPATPSGFLPARYMGKDTGFEYYCERDGNDFTRVSLRWSGDPREAVSAIIAAACLCQLTGGELFDPQSGDTISAAETIAWARRCEADLLEVVPKQVKKEDANSKPNKGRSRPWWRLW